MHPPGSTASLADLSIKTASLIENSDNLYEQDASPGLSHVLCVLQELAKVESKIHAWMASHYKTTAGSQYHFTAAPYRRIQGALPLFRLVYDFSDLGSNLVHIGYWICLLALVDAQVDILKTYRRLLDVESAQFLQLEKLVTEYADNICMSIAFMTKPDCGWSGRVIAIRPL